MLTSLLILMYDAFRCSAEMKVTHKQMKDARLPLEYRDYCAHLLIPLNECRLATNGWPWKCQHERHAYERCEYNECVHCTIPLRVQV
jgi:NADH dehydrogenase (ubiquinone) 1 beta subcomplex subunit 7